MRRRSTNDTRVWPSFLAQTCLSWFFLGRSLLAAASFADPLSIPATQYWDGNDGPWSSFALQVGTPGQDLRLFPHSSDSSTLVVLPEGCTPTDPEDCPDLRGSIFKSSRSTTWEPKGLFKLDSSLEALTSYHGKGLYGIDTLSFGWDYNAPSIKDQVIAGIKSKDVYLGSIGLGFQPLNLSNSSEHFPSVVGSLTQSKEADLSSASWAYTAGSANHVPATFGSLTLGGYDRSRFVPNSLSFSLRTDMAMGLTLALQQISTDNTNGDIVTVMDSPISISIESIVPQIWLPKYMCDRFEETFRLSYDSETEMYFVTDEAHAEIRALNPIIKFTLAATRDSQATVQIEMPYSSFDLEVKYPYTKPGQTQRYFPIRRTPPNAQSILGRAFLQNAYIIVDYDRRNFSVSQAVFPRSATGLGPDLVAIRKPDSSSSDDGSVGDTSNAWILAMFCFLAPAVLLSIFAHYVLRDQVRERERKARDLLPGPELEDTSVTQPRLEEADGRQQQVGRPESQEIHEADQMEVLVEIGTGSIAELDVSGCVGEMPNAKCNEMNAKDGISSMQEMST